MPTNPHHGYTRERKMANYRFVRKLSDGSTYRLGTAVHYPDGWRFISNVTSHKSSRKFHPTMEKCLPRWLGYPDHCESEEVTPIREVPAQEIKHDQFMAKCRRA